jgi:hypothetical protein
VSAGARPEPSPAAYEALIAHAELELELAGRGDVPGMLALAEGWDELVARLPSSPPPGARELLERATLIHERTRIELIRLREGLQAEFATTLRARRTADGYAGALPARPRVDQNA